MADKVKPVPRQALPPAGHSRSEEMKRRADVLEEERERKAEALGRERIDPKKMRIDREIAQHFDLVTNRLEVSNPDPNYEYCWVCSRDSSSQVDRKLGEGWEVVQGEMPEARERMGIRGDTTRHVGDTVLMRLRKDYYYLLEKRRAYRAAMQQDGVNAQLEDMVEGVRRKGYRPVVHTDLSESPTMQTAFAKHMAGSKFDEFVKEGRVPGMPAPGTRR